MKKVIVISASLILAVGAYAQGQINFNNRVVGSVVALIYGPEPGNPTLAKTGNTSGGTPMGSQTYGGALLAGTGFTVELWAGPAGSAESALSLCTSGTGNASTTFRTGSGAGIVNALADAATVPGIPGGANSRATFQVRAWDNANGSLTTWAAVTAPANLLIARGASELFTPNIDLGMAPNTPPNLIGLTSFNIHAVPEPSAIALGVIGLGSLMFLRRRK